MTAPFQPFVAPADPFNVYIGWDSRFPEPALVLADSIRRRASCPVAIHFLDLAHLRDCYGFKPKHDPKASTEFTYSRFLVPWLQNYAGVAAFVDNDLGCFGDVAELAALPMCDLALRCTQHDYKPPEGEKMYGVVQQPYFRKLWSSFMLLNCSKLRCWTKAVVEEANGARLHRFQDVPDDQIGEIDLNWNEVKRFTPATKMFHWTEGMVWNKPGWEAAYAEGRHDRFPFDEKWYDLRRQYMMNPVP